MLKFIPQRLKYKNRLDDMIIFNRVSDMEFHVRKEGSPHTTIRNLISEQRIVALDFEGGPYLTTGNYVLYNTDPIIDEPRGFSMGAITPEWEDLTIDSIESIRNSMSFQDEYYKIVCKYSKEIVWDSIK